MWQADQFLTQIGSPFNKSPPLTISGIPPGGLWKTYRDRVYTPSSRHKSSSGNKSHSSLLTISSSRYSCSWSYHLLVLKRSVSDLMFYEMNTLQYLCGEARRMKHQSQTMAMPKSFEPPSMLTGYIFGETPSTCITSRRSKAHLLSLPPVNVAFPCL